jgi:L-ascorbate metabolism protein UlaG (beta-lactamase superfamily)
MGPPYEWVFAAFFSVHFFVFMLKQNTMKQMLLLFGFIFMGSCTSSMDVYKEKLFSATTESDSAVRVVWLGTAGLYVSDGETGFFIDPFVSRYGVLKVICGFSLPPMIPEIEDCIQKVGGANARAVIVRHSHYDHALDAPFFARKTGAVLVGSASTAQIGRGAGLPEKQIRVVQPGEQYAVGSFKITFIKSRHSKAVLGRIPWPGEIITPLIQPAAASDYRLGETFTIHVAHPKGSFVHMGSAGFIEGMFAGMTADTIFLSVAGREDTRELLGQSAAVLQPKQIIPIHFDNFFQPLDKDMTILWGADLPEFFQTTATFDPGIDVCTLPIGQTTLLFQ